MCFLDYCSHCKLASGMTMIGTTEVQDVRLRAEELCPLMCIILITACKSSYECMLGDDNDCYSQSAACQNSGVLALLNESL